MTGLEQSVGRPAIPPRADWRRFHPKFDRSHGSGNSARIFGHPTGSEPGESARNEPDPALPPLGGCGRIRPRGQYRTDMTSGRNSNRATTDRRRFNSTRSILRKGNKMIGNQNTMRRGDCANHVQAYASRVSLATLAGHPLKTSANARIRSAAPRSCAMQAT